MKEKFIAFWKDPVWSKVIAFIICAILTFVYSAVVAIIDKKSLIGSFFKVINTSISLKYLFISSLIIFIVWLLIRFLNNKKKLKYLEEHKELDRKTLAKFKALLPSSGSISFIRTHNFAGNAFRIDNLANLENFTVEDNNPEFEFIDPELNLYLTKIKENISIFYLEIGTNTWPISNPNIYANSVPPEWEDEQPERFREVVNKIHSTARIICSNYDELIKLAKRKLGA